MYTSWQPKKIFENGFSSSSSSNSNIKHQQHHHHHHRRSRTNYSRIRIIYCINSIWILKKKRGPRKNYHHYHYHYYYALLNNFLFIISLSFFFFYSLFLIKWQNFLFLFWRVHVCRLFVCLFVVAVPDS